MKQVRLPNPPKSIDPATKAFLEELIRTLNETFKPFFVNPDPYILTNFVTSVRDLDVNTATLQEVREILATLLKDLQNAGIINTKE